MRTTTIIAAAAALISEVSAHLVLTYPGWRGDNLHNSGNLPDGTIPPNGLGANWDNTSQSLVYPYGMQWIYPCRFPSHGP